MRIQTKLHDLILFIKKYYTYIIFNTLIICLAFIISIYTELNTHLHYMDFLVQDNIEEYNEVDLSHLCNITKCNEIILVNYTDSNYTYAFSIFTKRDILKYKEDRQIEFYYLFDDIYYYNKKLYIYNPNANIYISIPYQEKVQELFFSFLKLFVFIFLSTIYLIYSTFRYEQKESLFHSVGNEAILANKSMIMITENIHHEMNTPVEVIDNKSAKIHKQMKKYITDPIALNKFETDFEYIKVSIEQIYGVLSKMKNFKSLRYSNGNKTIYDILNGAFRIISISNTDFDYKISKDFQRYRINSKILKNVDLLNIIINHLKNSLEANANEITVISVYKIQKGELSIRIHDNGTGIPDNVLPYIFDPNFSTKTNNEIIRGNGMYLNKYIINQINGDIKVLDTSPKGTTIEILLPVRPVNE